MASEHNSSQQGKLLLLLLLLLLLHGSHCRSFQYPLLLSQHRRKGRKDEQQQNQGNGAFEQLVEPELDLTE
jgi:hypothetical protein